MLGIRAASGLETLNKAAHWNAMSMGGDSKGGVMDTRLLSPHCLHVAVQRGTNRAGG